MRILTALLCLLASSLAGFGASSVGIKIDDLPATNASPEAAIMIINQPIGARLTNDTFKTVVSNLFTSRVLRQATVQISGATPFYYAGFDADGYLTSLAPPSSPTSGITGTLTAPYVVYATSAGTVGSTAFGWDGSSNMTGPDLTLTNSLTVYGSGTNAANNLIITNWLVLSGPLYWGPGDTNSLYRSGDDLFLDAPGVDHSLVVTNSTASASANVSIDSTGAGASFTGGTTSATYGISSGTVGVVMSSNGKVYPTVDNTIDFGSRAQFWKDFYLKGKVYVTGNDNQTDYARLALYYSGVAGPILFDSQATGTNSFASFAFAQGGTNILTITPVTGAGIQLRNPTDSRITFLQGSSGYTVFDNTAATGSPTTIMGPGYEIITVNNLGSLNPIGAKGLLLSNPYVAAAGVTQNTPGISWSAQGYGTNSATSQAVLFGSYVIPANGADAPTGKLVIDRVISNSSPVRVFELSTAATFPDSATYYLDGSGNWSVPAGGGGGQTPWTSDINGATYSLTNALRVEASSLKTAAPSGASASTFTLGVYSGGGSNVARLVMGATTYDLSTNSTGTAALDIGFNEYTSYGTLQPIPYTTYTDLEFPTGGVVETDALSAGTYLVTAKVGFGMYRSGGAELRVRLFSNDPATPGPDQPLAGSYALVGSENSPAGFYANYSATIQGIAPITTPGSKVIVQVYDTVTGDLDSYMQADQTSISWIRTQ